MSNKIDLFSPEGERIKKVSLPDTLFSQKPNSLLIAQAARVFLANQRKAHAKAKTRGEVRGSTRKIWRQKGTGRARHGDRYAPIFVGGGVAHGPTGIENWHLKIAKKMKKKALFSTLSEKAKEGKIVVVADLDKLGQKTKIAAKLLSKIKEEVGTVKKTLLIIINGGKKDNSHTDRIFRNLKGLKIRGFNNLDTYTVLDSDLLIFQPESLKAFIKFWSDRTK